MYENKFQKYNYKSQTDEYEDWYLSHEGKSEGDCIVYLHGHGSHGDQLLTREDVQGYCFPFLFDLGMHIVSPNLRDNAWMCPLAVDDLFMILDEGKRKYSWKRIFIVSGSMGGTGALIFAMRHPELIDGVAALGAATSIKRYMNWCTDSPKEIVNKEIYNAIAHAYTEDAFDLNDVCKHAGKLRMPVLLYHGGADDVIPPVEAQSLNGILRGKGNFYYHEIPGGNHDSPLPFYREAVLKLINT